MQNELDKATDMAPAGHDTQGGRGAVVPGFEAEYLKLLLDNLNIGVSLLDKDMRYRMISDSAYANMKVEPERLPLGSTLDECHAAMVESGTLTEEIIREMRLSAEDNDSDDNRVHTSNGGRLLKLADGTVHHHWRKPVGDGMLLAMATDVTHIVERDRMMEEALMLGQAGYWIYDFATREYTLSESFRAHLGSAGVKRIRTQGIIACIHPEDRHLYKEGLESLKAGKERFSVESRNYTADKRMRWNHTTVQMVRDADGRPTALRAFVRDTTRMHLKEEELKRAKDEAIAASHAKSEFLANMSHEIRTPMNGVLGMAELLAASAVDDRQREYINVINSSASALLNIINDILDFSKIEAGALEIDPMPFDLRSSVADVTALLVATAQDKGLELIIDYPEDLPRHFIGDAGRIRQILTNLVGNAIKFTEDGYVKIAVNVRTKGGLAVISMDVTDTGIGISDDKRAAIFDKFTQADGSTTRVYGGTGLGLTITKRIIEMMGGRVSVRSTLGEGSTFTARIPLPIDANARRERFDTALLAGKRVLVVDDIDVNCNVLKRQVGAWDMVAECAHNGVSAVAAVQEAAAEGRPYDLILLDYLMPGLNGRELAAMLSARSDIDMPPAIMLSSCDQPVSSQEMAQAGIESYLVKPVRERRLYDTVVRVLSNRPDAIVDASLAEAPESQPLVVSPIAHDLEERALPSSATIPAIDVTATIHDAAPSDRQDILVAEDFALNRDVVRLMLENSAFNPVFAENGQIALDMYTSAPERFPLIVMDVSMPVMDGHTATQKIRAWEREDRARGHVPIIALTGHAMKADQQDCVDAGMDDVLTKPVKQAALLGLLEQHSGRVVEAARRTA